MKDFSEFNKIITVDKLNEIAEKTEKQLNESNSNTEHEFNMHVFMDVLKLYHEWVNSND